MSAQILDGKALAQKIKEALKQEIKEIKDKTGQVPCFVNIMIGQDHAASAYAGSQQKAADYIGAQYKLEILAQKTSPEELRHCIEKLNKNPRVHGIMIHKPVPAQIDYTQASDLVAAHKALEGINIVNFGKMIGGQTKIIPCTAAAVMEHISATKVNLRGKQAVVVGRSEIVGKPVSLLLLAQNATVTVCHSATTEAQLADHIGRADVLVVAVGKANFIKGKWIKQGAIVVDVGINQLDNKMVGDVEFEAAKERAGFITPVPGGVGPVTVMMLMRNGVETFKAQIHQDNKVKV